MTPDTFFHTYQAGLVKRHHVNPSDAVQQVGQHSWGVAMVLDYIWPEASKRVILAALRHDVPERWLGDVPATVKWAHPDIAFANEEAEARIINLIGYEDELNEKEVTALKLADMLELWLFAGHRVHMGDRYFKQVRDNVDAWFLRNEDHLTLFPTANIILNYGTDRNAYRAHA